MSRTDDNYNPAVKYGAKYKATDITAENLPAYDDDAAAATAGLAAGQLYQTTGSGSAPLNEAGIVMVKQ